MQDKDEEILRAAQRGCGVYVHVPFCARLCAFCQFYKISPEAQDVENYLDALQREASFRISEGLEKNASSTMFWGGGTPAMLSLSQLERAADIFAPLFPFAEWTVECAPASINPRKLSLMRELGVNRISLGVQSFNQKTLEALGRPHSLAAALRAIDAVTEAGFEKFSVDLIFSSEGQTLSGFEEDLKRAAQCGANHLSAYCLEFESGTSCCAGKGKTPVEMKREAVFMELAMDALPSLGFPQYEISNYAKPGAECLHNLKIWNMEEWLGFGPSAASQYRATRFKNPANLDAWARMQNSGPREYEDVVPLDDAELLSSALIFGLRTNRGVDMLELKRRFPNADFDTAQKKIFDLLEEGLLESKTLRNPCGYRYADTLRLTREGRLLADSVGEYLL